MAAMQLERHCGNAAAGPPWHPAAGRIRGAGAGPFLRLLPAHDSQSSARALSFSRRAAAGAVTAGPHSAPAHPPGLFPGRVEGGVVPLNQLSRPGSPRLLLRTPSALASLPERSQLSQRSHAMAKGGNTPLHTALFHSAPSSTRPHRHRPTHCSAAVGSSVAASTAAAPSFSPSPVQSIPAGTTGARQQAPAQLLASVGVPVAAPLPTPRVGPRDIAVLSLCFVACAISAAFSVVLMAAVPALLALRQAALAIEQLAIMARQELPGTMAAVRLSGMEISDLTMELSDLSQEITEGVRTSTRAVKAAEDGLNRMKSYAQKNTVAILEERAAVPVEAVRPPPTIATAARRTKEVISGARGAAAQASMLGQVWKYLPFGAKANEAPKTTRPRQSRVRYS